MNTIDSIALSFIISILTAWTAVMLAFAKYKSEKWWDRKAQYYCETINSLNEIIRVCDEFINEKIHGVIIQTDSRLDFDERFRKAKLLCFTQINIGELFMSEQAHKLIMGFEGKLSEIERSFPHDDLWEVIREETEAHIKSLISMARRDLGANSFGLIFVSSFKR
jgi:hypothetical protein